MFALTNHECAKMHDWSSHYKQYDEVLHWFLPYLDENADQNSSRLLTDASPEARMSKSQCHFVVRQVRDAVAFSLFPPTLHESENLSLSCR